jgi:hypothetical protein
MSTMKAINFSIRFSAIAAGLLGVIGLLGSAHMIILTLAGGQLPDLPRTILLVTWLSLSSYFSYLGYLALVDYSPFIIRNSLSILSLVAFASITDTFYVPSADRSAAVPFIFFATAFLIYWVYSACSRALVRITFPDREPLQSTGLARELGARE